MCLLLKLIYSKEIFAHLGELIFLQMPNVGIGSQEKK